MQEAKKACIGCLILSAGLLSVPFVFPVCLPKVYGAAHMACWYTWRAETGIALLAALGSLYLFVDGQAAVRKAVGILLGGCALLAAALPQHWFLGRCFKDEMACHQTYIVTEMVAVLLLAAAVVLFFSGRKEKEGRRS